jgi:hypothetical protein
MYISVQASHLYCVFVYTKPIRDVARLCRCIGVQSACGVSIGLMLVLVCRRITEIGRLHCVYWCTAGI